MIDFIGRSGPQRPLVSAGDGVAKPNDLRAKVEVKSTQISGIARELAVSAPIDAARVAALRSAIAGGTYKPDPDRIAAAMIRLETGSRG
jgi:negative regulator of flagellin synthesis FlgM